jgi:hypothetical protein
MKMTREEFTKIILVKIREKKQDYDTRKKRLDYHHNKAWALAKVNPEQAEAHFYRFEKIQEKMEPIICEIYKLGEAIRKLQKAA